MSDFEAHLALLPTGFVDLMPEDAEKEARAIHALMGLFTGYGYSRIKPPLMEFEDSLLAPGPGASLSKDTFRVMDPVSRRMLGIRADITPQIARIVCTRLPKDQAPMRLTYANDVLRASAGQLRSARQFTQVGCEITGDDSADSYAESLTLAVLGIKALGIENITLDLTLPRLFDDLVKSWNIDKNTASALLSALDKRDRDRVKEIEFTGQETVLKLLDSTGRAEDALQVLSALDLPDSLAEEVQKLGVVVEKVQTALGVMGVSDVMLTFDAFETRGFEYHSGIAFTLFAKGIRGELGRGGHYFIIFGQEEEANAPFNAIGFTLYMDTIRPGVCLTETQKILAVPLDMDWKTMENYRQQGWSILRFDDKKDVPQHATHIFNNGKPEERT